MQQIFDIHDYDEHFLEQFTSHLIPIYDLWSIRPLQNEQKELISGSSEEVEKFRNFIIDHTNKDYPHPLIIVIGNAEKGNSRNMSNTTKRYFKIKFEKFKGNDLGSPLALGYSQPYTNGSEQMIPLGFMGNMQRPMMNNGMQGFSLGDIQGIIDRNVNDAARSIKAEYEELSAKREVESIKRIAELETKMELHKLEIREKEIEAKEQQLQEDIEAFEEKRLEGLGTVKDYTKTIASGLMELGKTAFGLDNLDSKKKDKTDKNKTDKSGKDQNLGGTRSTSFDDEGFTENKSQNKEEKSENNSNNNKSNNNTEQPNNKNNNDAFETLLEVVKNLNEEQKCTLMNVLIPEEEEIQKENNIENSQENQQNNEENENVQS